ncbi:hypothetical protein F4680DRAFT_421564 [Xylaria scruposa]|nr:hypothetical protein F4680DRAFT_421564 [Xylaria scruposa]
MERLPTEIIGQICGALCHHCRPCPDEKNLRLAATGSSRHALLNLCLTSSRLRAIAQPVLYHHIYIWDEDEERCTYLLHTIFARPDLGRAVRYLIIAEDAQGKEWTGPDPGDWWRTGGADRFVQRLLVRVPRIEVLWIQPWAPKTWDFLVNNRYTQSLPALRRVHVEYNNDCDLSGMTSLFSLATNIDSLAIRYCQGLSCTLSLQNVTCLILNGCLFSPPCMRRLLSSCGKLDTFAYRDEQFDEVVLDVLISPYELIGLLEEQGHNFTLRRLYICCNNYKEHVRSLVSFSRLQILRLNFWTWPKTISEDLQAEWLPPSLEEIGLCDLGRNQQCTPEARDSWRHPSFVEWIEWISAKASSGFFPRLKKTCFSRPEAQEKFQHLKNITCLQTENLALRDLMTRIPM